MTNNATTVFPMPVGRTTSVDLSIAERATEVWYSLSSTLSFLISGWSMNTERDMSW